MADPYPLRTIMLRVVAADVDPINSNAAGFRRAGRDAGKKFMAAAITPNMPTP